ncbi:MAG: helix-turn-helix transcriptional regulator [Roseovarius sp.]|nr:helix-turn-helix transcriptional regulator [Roseovarius sp.]
MTGTQIRAARALLEMEQYELAERASVSINTVRNMEAMGRQVVRVRLDTLMKVQKALEDAGVEFIAENGGGAGVRLRKVKDEESSQQGSC